MKLVKGQHFFSGAPALERHEVQDVIAAAEIGRPCQGERHGLPYVPGNEALTQISGQPRSSVNLESVGKASQRHDDVQGDVHDGAVSFWFTLEAEEVVWFSDSVDREKGGECRQHQWDNNIVLHSILMSLSWVPQRCHHIVAEA